MDTAILWTTTVLLVATLGQSDARDRGIIQIHSDIGNTNCNSNETDYKLFYDAVRYNVTHNAAYNYTYPDDIVICIPTSKTCGLTSGYVLVPHSECCESNESSYFGPTAECQQCQLEENVYSHPSYETVDKHGVYPISCSNIKSTDDYTLKQEDFTWCLYIMNTGYNLHTCFNTTHTISETPEAATLSLSRFFEISGESLSNTGLLRVIQFDQILHEALLSCSVDKEEIKAIHFFQLLLDSERNIYYLGTEALPKYAQVNDRIHSTCLFTSRLTVGTFMRILHNGEVLPMVECDGHPTEPTDTYYTKCHSKFINSCRREHNPFQNSLLISLTLHINVTTNSTGSYTCEAYSVDTRETLARSPPDHLPIVYYQTPDDEVIIESNIRKMIPCSIKAPTTVTVGWTLNGAMLPSVEANATTYRCHGAVITHEVRQFDDEYALHTTNLHLCNTSTADSNLYTCFVIENNETMAEVSASIVVMEPIVITPPSNLTVLAPAPTQSTGLIVIYITVPLVLCVLVLITVVTLILVIRKLRVKSHSQDVHKTKFHLNNNIYQSNLNATDPMKWECPRESLNYLRELGTGRFGRVYLAQLKTEDNERIVAIKTLKSVDNFETAAGLVAELEIMKCIQPHNNICNLIGQCTTVEGPPCIILEYAVHGCLKDLLLKCRQSVLDSQQELKLINEPDNNCDQCPKVDYLVNPGQLHEDDVYYMATQILKGLAHLERQQILHRDIGARNILISKGFILKVSDFGLSKNMSEKEYYRKLTNGLVPVKWVAVEALEQSIYTTKSDVWSFGVLLWEMATYGDTPYSNINLSYGWQDFLQYLKSGNRLPIPAGCSEPLYDTMKKCWTEDPVDRPSFLELTQDIVDTTSATTV